MLKGLACAKKKKKKWFKENWEANRQVCVCLVAQSCLTFCDPMDCSLPGSSVHGIFFCLSPGKNTGVGFHFLLHGISPTQGSNTGLLHLLHWQVNFSPLSYLGSPTWENASLIQQRDKSDLDNEDSNRW